MYSYESRIRYSELDATGHLKIEALLDYFQDCSTFHSEDLGVGVEYLKKENRVWVLSSWQIIVERYPRLGERVTIATVPYDFKGFIGFRNFWMLDGEGKRIACANTIWTLIDTENNKPVKPSQEILDTYTLSEKIDMDYAPRKITLPSEMIKGEEIEIRQHHLDTNRHVNNVQYVRIAMDNIPGECKIRQLRAEYKKQSYLGDALVPYVSAGEDGTYVVVLKDKEENIACVVEISK